MKVVLIRHPTPPRRKSWKRWTEDILLIVGLASLSWWGMINLNTYVFQKREKAHFEAMSLRDRNAREKPLPGPKRGEFVGEIDIPRLGISAVILEGSDGHNLQLGVGHIVGTALPGDAGNVSLAAHRDTFFRPLRMIRRNDEIRLRTLDGNYNYRVDWTRVVSPDDVDVLRPSQNPALTLITCYPFHFVGSAPERFIVRAHRVPG